MISGLLPKLGIGVLSLGTAAASGYGVYELARTKSISEILGREHRVLKTAKDQDKNDWGELVKKYKEAPEFSDENKTSPKKIKDFPSTGDATEDDLRSKCSEFLKKSYVKDDDQYYIDAKNWCTDSQIKGK